jgi:prevent-host-death family protein
MRTVNVHDAKTHLSRLLEEVEAGEEIVIARAGKPVALLRAYTTPVEPRRLGTSLGRISIAADFDQLPSDMDEGLAGVEK